LNPQAVKEEMRDGVARLEKKPKSVFPTIWQVVVGDWQPEHPAGKKEVDRASSNGRVFGD